MNSIEKLIRIFSEFPGIGPRQARRFVYYLLTRKNDTLTELSKNILELKSDVASCSVCHRFFQRNHESERVCKICRDPNRDHETLMVVERDIDLEAVEKNGVFKGTYFVLGGSVPILEKEPEKRIRLNELKTFLNDRSFKEIILGMSWNPEGENTADLVKKFIQETWPMKSKNLKISSLGKGLSMGTELEYTDPDTLRNALKNRA